MEKVIGKSLIFRGIGFLIWILLFTSPLLADSDTLEIGFAGPLSGTEKSTGESMVQAVELYFKQINEKGGVDGKQLVLKKFDDTSATEKAFENAHKIAASNVLAVIGHHYSEISIRAGEVYRQEGIPAVSPGSTSPLLTKNNEWYFRTIYSDSLPARFCAKYVQSIFKEDTVTIISDDGAYGKFLGESFQENAKKLGLKVGYYHVFPKNDPNLLEKLDQITQEVSKLDKPGVIFIGSHAYELAQLIRRLRDAGISNKVMSGNAIVNRSFVNEIRKFAPERVSFYTHEVYGAAPYLFDTANREAQLFRSLFQKAYGQEPEWSSAFAYDAALMIVEAIKKAGIAKKSDDNIQLKRLKIRNALKTFDSYDTAIPGLTGPNFFTPEGDSIKPVAIGVYQGPYLIAALSQLQLIPHPEEISNLADQIENSHILQLNDLYFFKTTMVYTGVKLIRLDSINFIKKTFQAEFFLWFRYPKGLDPDNIELKNVIELKEFKKIHTETEGQQLYALYRVQATFQGRSENPDRLGRFTFDLKFRHKHHPRQKLIFTPDSIGMGTTRIEELLATIKQEQVVDPEYKLDLDQLNIHEKSTLESALGAINTPSTMVEFSLFTVSFRLAQQGLKAIFQNQIYLLIAYLVLDLILCIVLTALFFKAIKYYSRKLSISMNGELIKIIVGPFRIFLFLCGLFLALEEFQEYTSENVHVLISNLIELGIAVTILIGMGFRSAKLIGRYSVEFARSTETELDDLVAPYIGYIIKFMSVALVCMKLGEIVFGLSAISFLGLLGGFGIAIGLLFKDIISEIVACIIILLDSLFKVDDKISINGSETAFVKHIGLRTTQIKYSTGQLAKIPNTTIINATVKNFSHNESVTTKYHLKIEGITTEKLKELIKELKGVLKSTEGILGESNNVSFTGFQNDARVVQIIVNTSADWLETQATLERLNLNVLQLLETHQIDLKDYQFIRIS